MLPDPDIPIGCGTMIELHHVDILVGALRCQLLGTRIQTCSAQCGRKRHGHHEKGRAQESHAEAMDLGIQDLLSMAAELFAELSAKLAARILSNLSVMMLVQLPVGLPYNLAQTLLFLGKI